MKSSNPTATSRLQRTLRRDLDTLALFTALYCKKRHSAPKHPLNSPDLPKLLKKPERYRYCDDCRTLLLYAIERRMRCPLDPKPACRACPHNCYAESQRIAMRRIMGFAGPHLIRRGRIDLLWRLYSP